MRSNGYRHSPYPSFGSGWREDRGASAHSMPVVDLRDLMEQTEGEAHCLFQGQVVRANLFYANPDIAGAVVRIPRMLEIDGLD
jgi:intracellular multiplication protein IcmO